MPIDPVLVLLEELREADVALKAARNFGPKKGPVDRAAVMDVLHIKIEDARMALSVTTPTSALGASELVKLAAERLPLTLSPLAARFRKLAQRLAAGRRLHADLVRMRALLAGAECGLYAGHSAEIASLLRLAIKGAAAPILIFRAVDPPPLAKRTTSSFR
jgi:hypothetical protein